MDTLIHYFSAKELFFPEIDYSDRMFSLAIHVFKQNARQGTVACKDREALTSRSNKKPWKQKGTGRARAGSPRSPLWRGGAVSHGPRQRVRVLSVNKKVNKGALKIIFSNKLQNQKVVSLNFVPKKSCSEASLLLKKNNLLEKKIVLFYNVDDYETYYSFSNIKNIILVSYDSVNPYVLARGEYLVTLDKDRVLFEGLVKSWLV